MSDDEKTLAQPGLGRRISRRHRSGTRKGGAVDVPHVSEELPSFGIFSGLGRWWDSLFKSRKGEVVLDKLNLYVYVDSRDTIEGGKEFRNVFSFRFNVEEEGEYMILTGAGRSVLPRAFSKGRFAINGGFRKFLSVGGLAGNDVRINDASGDHLFLEVMKDDVGVPIFRVVSGKGFAHREDQVTHLKEYSLGTFVVDAGKKLQPSSTQLEDNAVWILWDIDENWAKYRVVFSIVARESSD